MRELFGDLLPDPLISRRSKANFSHSFFNAFSRRFVETWSGRVWMTLSLTPNTSWIRGGSRSRRRSYSLVQAAWCASSGDH